jgi:hypothetical protein
MTADLTLSSWFYWGRLGLRQIFLEVSDHLTYPIPRSNPLVLGQFCLTGPDCRYIRLLSFSTTQHSWINLFHFSCSIILEFFCMKRNLYKKIQILLHAETTESGCQIRFYLRYGESSVGRPTALQKSAESFVITWWNNSCWQWLFEL